MNKIKIEELQNLLNDYDREIDKLLASRARTAETLRRLKAEVAIKEDEISLNKINRMEDSPLVNNVTKFVKILKERGKLKPFIEWNGSVYACDSNGNVHTEPLCHLSDLSE